MRKLAAFALAVGTLIGTGGLSSGADDPFLWLEEREGDRAIAWVTEQSAKTAAAISSDARFASYMQTTLDLFSAEDNVAYGYPLGGKIYNFWQDGTNVLGLWRRTTVDSYKTDAPQWETVIDFDALAKTEGIEWVFSNVDCLAPDYVRCLIQLSPDGGDAVEIREFDLETKAFVKDGFFSPVSKSGFSWLDRDHVYVSAAYDEDQRTTSGYPRLVKLLKRGQPLTEAKTIHAVDKQDLAVAGYVARDGDAEHSLIYREIDFYNAELFVLSGGDARRLDLPTDVSFSHFFKDQFVFSLRSAWTAPDGTAVKPGGLYSFDFKSWNATGEIGPLSVVFEPTPRMAVTGTASTRDRFFVSLVDNVRGRVLAFDRVGKEWKSELLDLPDNGEVAIYHTDGDGSSISFSFQDFLTPPSLLWSEDDGRTLQTVKAQAARFDASPYVSEQHEATSKDGTRVPYFVVRNKDQTGPVPTWLYGYGGFEVSMTPWYSGLRGKLWLEQGNAYVLANIRGGGEFGPAWHQAALKENRQRAYDDFAAIAEDLVRRGLTTPAQLGMSGGSNGGLLVGVMLTQRPELFGAVISDVPLLDMLRYTQLPAGASWIAEYGDPAIPEEAAYIAKYSPYQNVRPDAKYPPSMFTTSTADDRVHPGHARKMAALMQSLGHETLFHENTQGGHGGSGDVRAQALTYVLQYLFLQRSLEGASHPTLAQAPSDRSAPIAGEAAAFNAERPPERPVRGMAQRGGEVQSRRVDMKP